MIQKKKDCRKSNKNVFEKLEIVVSIGYLKRLNCKLTVKKEETFLLLSLLFVNYNVILHSTTQRHISHHPLFYFDSTCLKITTI